MSKGEYRIWLEGFLTASDMNPEKVKTILEKLDTLDDNPFYIHYPIQYPSTWPLDPPFIVTSMWEDHTISDGRLTSGKSYE